MRSEIVKKILQETPQDVKDRVRVFGDEPFSKFGVILSEELTNWDVKNWDVDDYIDYAASESWSMDEFTEHGYIALKRMIEDLVNPNKDDLDYEQFKQRLKQLYEYRKNNR